MINKLNNRKTLTIVFLSLLISIAIQFMPIVGDRNALIFNFNFKSSASVILFLIEIAGLVSIAWLLNKMNEQTKELNAKKTENNEARKLLERRVITLNGKVLRCSSMPTYVLDHVVSNTFILLVEGLNQPLTIILDGSESIMETLSLTKVGDVVELNLAEGGSSFGVESFKNISLANELVNQPSMRN